jgi:hypothetical protein
LGVRGAANGPPDPLARVSRGEERSAISGPVGEVVP